MKYKVEDFTIIIDSREKKPYTFGLYSNVRTEIGSLKSGDYSIKGLESSITIERKTKSDAYGSLGKNRKRFENEVKRMSEMKFSFILIETSFRNFLRPPRMSQMNPKAAINTLFAWWIKYRVPFVFSDNREMSEALIVRVFEKYIVIGG